MSGRVAAGGCGVGRCRRRGVSNRVAPWSYTISVLRPSWAGDEVDEVLPVSILSLYRTPANREFSALRLEAMSRIGERWGRSGNDRMLWINELEGLGVGLC